MTFCIKVSSWKTDLCEKIFKEKFNLLYVFYDQTIQRRLSGTSDLQQNLSIRWAMKLWSPNLDNFLPRSR